VTLHLFKLTTHVTGVKRSTAALFKRVVKATFHDTDNDILADSPDTPTSLRGCRRRVSWNRPMGLKISINFTSSESRQRLIQWHQKLVTTARISI